MHGRQYLSTRCREHAVPVSDAVRGVISVTFTRLSMSARARSARANGATLPVTALVDQFYADIQKMGGRRWDTSSLIARLEHNKADV